MLRVALIGRPLRRRHSEVMHNAAFAARGIDAHYELRDIGEEELAAFVAEARQPGWLGFQVTAPHKQAILPLLDEVEESALRIGAVNSGLRTDAGRLVGFNTDAPGFRRAVEEELDVDLGGARVAIAGAGGVAHAIAFALVDAGAQSITIGSRRPEAAAHLAQRYADAHDGITATALEGPAFGAALADADLVVNATTVGMTSSGTVFDVDAIGHAAVFDCVYVPPETELIRQARGRGLLAANGGGMLIRQAVVAFERWTGIGDVTDVMAAAVAPLLAEAGEA